MAGIHGLKHVEGLLGTHLAEDHPVGPHPQGILDQFALADLTLAFEVGGARFHPRDVRLLKLKLGGVLDCDEAFLVTDRLGEGIEERRLA